MSGLGMEVGRVRVEPIVCGLSSGANVIEKPRPLEINEPPFLFFLVCLNPFNMTMMILLFWKEQGHLTLYTTMFPTMAFDSVEERELWTIHESRYV